MKGLIIKEFINLRKYGRTIFAVSAFYIAFGFIMKNTTFISGMIVLMFSMMAITTFTYDKQGRWDLYALSLPLKRRTIVMSKYAIAVLAALFGMLLSSVVGIAFYFIRDTNTIGDILMQSYALFVAAILILSILLPFIFKFGVEKSRFIMFAVLAVPAAIIFLFSSLGIKPPNEDQIMSLALLSPFLLIICVSISFAVSNSIFKRKEL